MIDAIARPAYSPLKSLGSLPVIMEKSGRHGPFLGAESRCKTPSAARCILQVLSQSLVPFPVDREMGYDLIVWHSSQEIEDLPDGRLLWRAHISEPREMFPWIRGWGSDVEVLGPPDLRERMMQEVMALGVLYGRRVDSKDVMKK